MNKKALDITCQLCPTVEPEMIERMIQQRIARRENPTLQIAGIQPTDSGGFVPISAAVWAVYCTAVHVP